MSWDTEYEPGVRAECYCGRGDYNPTRHSSCYECFQDRMADLTSCIYCGKKHSVDYATCFNCRQVTDRDEAAKALRFDILIRDQFTCNDCGSNESLQIDHIKPCASDGLADPWNLQVLCRDCNRDKGSNWYYGCRWDSKRIELMYIYLTYGWTLLDSEQQHSLLQDTADYSVFDWHARVRLHNGESLEPPDWAIEMADSYTASPGAAA